MKIIALGHEKRVGKDTTAKYLCTYLRQKYKSVNIIRTGFASKIKANCYGLFKHKGLMDEEFYEENPSLKDVIIPSLGWRPRDIWIKYGNWMREVSIDVWFDYPLFNLKCDVLIIKDLRYVHEAEKIKEKGGLCIKIDNPRITRTPDTADDDLLSYNQWDNLLINDGTLGDLFKKIEQLADQYETWLGLNK